MREDPRKRTDQCMDCQRLGARVRLWEDQVRRAQASVAKLNVIAIQHGQAIRELERQQRDRAGLISRVLAWLWR